MTLELLLSCMHQEDASLVAASRITGDVLLINQCSREGEARFPTANGTARMIFTTQRGLTRSRNLAVRLSRGDICLLCDDDETFVQGYEEKILSAYRSLPDGDIVIFKMQGRPSGFPDRVQRLRFPQTAKVSSWQISFRREALLRSGVRFDELLGAGTGNGAEEELRFLLDAQRAGLKIYYVPTEIATVAQKNSTWFSGFGEDFFENRGATTRYILGAPLAAVYALYYVARKRHLYRGHISPWGALKATFRGICRNPIGKQAEKRTKERRDP